MPAPSLILPFAVPSEGAQAFSPSMELATILLLTEAKRKKRGLLETTLKKTSFVSKLHYPLWAVPWENGSLIIDGLSFFSPTITSQALPDLTTFIGDVERGASVREQFWGVLKKHEKTFVDFVKTENIQIDSFIADRELLSAILEYVKETSSLELKANDTIVLAPPKIDQQTAIESVKHLSSLCRQVQSDTRGLEYTKNLLDQTLKLHEQMILKEIELIREAYGVEISKFRPIVEKKIDRLQKEQDVRMARMSRTADNELRTKEKERERRERELQRLESSRAEYLRKRETRKRRRDKIGETVWEHRVRVYDNRIEEAKSRIRIVSESIDKTRRQKENDMERLRYGFQMLIDQEKKKIVDIEILRDKNIETKQAEIANLKQATIQIMSHLENLMERKRAQEEEIKKLAIPWQSEDVALLCLPLYFICYQVGRKTQFQVFPPFRVTFPSGLVKTLQKTIGSLRPSSTLSLFLQPRSKALSRMLESAFQEKMKSDKVFSESLLQLATSSSILTKQGFKETLVKGVEELRVKEWIGQSQGEALVKAYASA